MKEIFGFSLAAVGLAWLGVLAVRRWALCRNVLDIPNERSSHVLPTPRGGGLAIVAVSLLGTAVSGIFGGMAQGPAGVYVFCAFGVAAISWLDDLRSVPALLRLGVHVICAVALVVATGSWNMIMVPGLGTVHVPTLGSWLTVAWIVGVTNAYNFMDGIDGIAGIQGAVAGMTWGCIGLAAGLPALAAFGFIVAAACMGFLFHNWPPARIFMGDVGSAFLGFTFAAFPLLVANRVGFNSGLGSKLPVAGLLVVWPFVLDAGFTFLKRLVRGDRVFQAHRTHVYQRWVALGARHRTVALVYGLLATVGGALAVGWIRGAGTGWFGLVPPLLGVAAWGIVASRERRRMGSDSGRRSADYLDRAARDIAGPDHLRGGWKIPNLHPVIEVRGSPSKPEASPRGSEGRNGDLRSHRDGQLLS